MHRSASVIAVALTITAWGALPGCSGHSWSGGGDSSGGIEIEHRTCDGRVYLVVAADGCSGGSSSSESGPTGSTTGGRLNAVDGRKIAWSCTTADGTRGTATIDGQQFDLANGAVFIVWAKDKKTRVEQLALDMAKLQGGPVPQKLRALAETHPRIAAFFKEADGGK
jgi:hypothetical protein